MWIKKDSNNSSLLKNNELTKLSPGKDNDKDKEKPRNKGTMIINNLHTKHCTPKY